LRYGNEVRDILGVVLAVGVDLQRVRESTVQGIAKPGEDGASLAAILAMLD
jgi:hypothetical protein